MTELFYVRSTCRLCGSRDITQAMSLVPMPIGDKYLPYDNREESNDTVPLDLMLCSSCGQFQTNTLIDPDRIYPHYLSRPAAVNPVLSDAYQAYAKDVLNTYRPAKGSLVVELGSNDGIFLNFFKNQGMSVLGVDPARNLADAATKSGIETLPTLFTSDVARQIRKDRGPASVVIANFVYANIDDIEDATDGIRELLTPDGVFMFETNYRVDVFQKHLIETITHEHVSYFAVKPFKGFFERHGMKLVDVERVPSKGGSIRCTVQPIGSQAKVSPSVEESIALEEDLGLFGVDFYRPCASHIEAVRAELGQMLGGATSERKPVAGYGTSIGATTLIYQLGLGDKLKFLVDDDPYRQNLVSPGYHIPVTSAQALHDQRPNYVLILAPLYSERIRSRNQEYADGGGRFVDVWPQIEVH